MRGGGETVRGTTGDIVLAAPAAGVSSSDAPVFSWHPIGEASGYVLEVQGADRGVVRSDTTADTTLRLPSALPAGEYRWWVRALLVDSRTIRSPLRTLRLTAR
jgi:hypothetical protein